MNIQLDQLGQLPFHPQDKIQRVNHCYQQLLAQKTDLEKNRYLHHLSKQDEAVFYTLMQKHLKAILPFLYTPTVGEAVQTFNQNFLGHSGLYLAWPHRNSLNTILDAYQEKSIDIAILTDGERILGLGDQGVGGIEICIAKGMLYSICADIDPRRILPIYVDVGTNNQSLLDDPLYLGWKHSRVQEREYDDFMENIVVALHRRFPNIYIHWEDLAPGNAQRLLKRHQETLCVFNDDIQGTGLVTLASILNAIQLTESSLEKQRIIIFGGGTAGIGIADQISLALQHSGLSLKQTKHNIWVLGRQGLLFTNSEKLTTSQSNYARPHTERSQYNVEDGHIIDLLATVQQVKPTILIGCSGQAKAFTQSIIETMAQHVKRPIILPLSNPSEYSEAVPEDLLRWTHGKALIATGSPFEDVYFNHQKYPIAQCNNALVFPGIGLGVLASGARLITEKMLKVAYEALCIATKENNLSKSDILLPDISDIRSVTQKIAFAVLVQAYTEKMNTLSIIDPVVSIQLQKWVMQ